MEIERKFLIQRLPEHLDAYPFQLLEQAYLCTEPVVRKKRYRIPLPDELTIELDLFDPPFEGLILAEVEFTSEEQARAFLPPEWFGEEVTWSTEYHNSTLSQRPVS